MSPRQRLAAEVRAAPAKVDDFLAKRMNPDCQVMIDRLRHTEEVKRMYHECKENRNGR
jgi:hypothetical protein